MKYQRVRHTVGALQQKGLFDGLHGGAREGAGRKRKAGRRRVPHLKRDRVTRHDPIHVTQRVDCAGHSLRTRAVRKVLLRCFGAGAERFGFRLVEYSIQSNHMHLITEADDCRALARGMQGLKVRIAKALNKLWGLRGRRFLDRYHQHVLRTLREIRNALAYVLHNARHHGSRLQGIDPFSSGINFKGWNVAIDRRPRPPQQVPTLAHAQSWKLQRGWRRYGLISPRAHASELQNPNSPTQ